MGNSVQIYPDDLYMGLVYNLAILRDNRPGIVVEEMTLFLLAVVVLWLYLANIILFDTTNNSHRRNRIYLGKNILVYH